MVEKVHTQYMTEAGVSGIHPDWAISRTRKQNPTALETLQDFLCAEESPLLKVHANVLSSCAPDCR